MKAKKMTKQQRRELAATLASMFQAHLIERTLVTMHRGRKIKTSLAMLAPTERRAFLRAAQTVHALDADPREFVTAQFQAWAGYSQAFGRYVLPHPTTLATLGAQARYLAYKQEQAARQHRKAPLAKALKGFYREERKLAGLVKHTRQPMEDVLTTLPEEFSREFLKAKGVWPIVKTLYQERTS